jgi:hypothetical protein
LDPRGISNSFDDIPESDFLFDQEARKTDAERLRIGFLARIPGRLFPFHEATLLFTHEAIV